MRKPVVMIIMDGIGVNDNEWGNGVKAAHTPTLDKLTETSPHVLIKAHGTAVGLPTDEDMGNSEVGHNALGSGQIYAQGAKLVNLSMESGRMYGGKTWKGIIDNCKSHKSALHFIGLLSDGNVHSHINHLKSMVKRAKEDGVEKCRIHILLDGRDVEAQSALKYVDDLEGLLVELNSPAFDGRIASGGGRMKITMDRYEADWSMVEEGWKTHVLGRGRMFQNAREAITTLRAERDVIDQDLPPFVIGQNMEPTGAIYDNDSVILFNFRGDRAIELCKAFEKEEFNEFNRIRHPKVVFAGLLQYDGDLMIPKNFLVSPPDIKNTLSELLIKNNVKQYAISETQKFGHVTYFWNGNRTEKFDEYLEDFKKVDSDKVPFEQRPWMKAAQITDNLIEALNSGKHMFLRANFPNGDMVGHTGDLRAAILGVETVDLCLLRIIEAVDRKKGILIVTADHGNAEEMLEKAKASPEPIPKTSHTLNPVIFLIHDGEKHHNLKEGNFGLANVAATVAELLGLTPPDQWEESMIRKS